MEFYVDTNVSEEQIASIFRKTSTRRNKHKSILDNWIHISMYNIYTVKSYSFDMEERAFANMQKFDE